MPVFWDEQRLVSVEDAAKYLGVDVALTSTKNGEAGMFSTIYKFQSELSVEFHRLSHVLDCQVDRSEVLYFHDAENGPGGGLGSLGIGGGGAGGLGGLSFMTASRLKIHPQQQVLEARVVAEEVELWPHSPREHLGSLRQGPSYLFRWSRPSYEALVAEGLTERLDRRHERVYLRSRRPAAVRILAALTVGDP